MNALIYFLGTVWHGSFICLDNHMYIVKYKYMVGFLGILDINTKKLACIQHAHSILG